MSTVISDRLGNGVARKIALPRLIYVADVPVEASYHGSALMYRLLQNYPTESLRVLETGRSGSVPQRRLEQVTYAISPLGKSRWLNTRFHRYVSTWLSLRAVWCSSIVTQQIWGFQPNGVLTVAHGYGWMAAARFACERQLPLHMIVHDDWPRMANLPSPFGAWLDRQFSRAYRQSVSRLCVSPYMEENYLARYGAHGTVLYPSRDAEIVEFAVPPERARRPSEPLTFAFGGTINTAGHVRALRLLSSALAKRGWCLNIYGPLSQEQALNSGLLAPNVKLCGLIPANEFIACLRAEVDVLFVPMSFAAEDRANMSLCFPSKVTDYTAAGLPLLIYGPDYSSAVRWARENPEVGDVVVNEEESSLEEALGRLVDPERRFELGVRALEVGKRYFSHTAAVEAFYRALDAIRIDS